MQWKNTLEFLDIPEQFCLHYPLCGLLAFFWHLMNIWEFQSSELCLEIFRFESLSHVYVLNYFGDMTSFLKKSLMP